MPKTSAKMTVHEIVAELRGMASEHNRVGMARFGIATEHALGISVANLRKLARRAGKDHALAQQLWDTGLHEARILASIVDVPAEVTEEPALEPDPLLPATAFDLNEGRHEG